MRFAIPVVLLLGFLLALPAAQAASLRLVLERGDGHPPEHPIDVPVDSRKAQIPLNVKILAKDFVCVQAQTYSVKLILEFPYEWAGASPAPDSTAIQIQVGKPGTEEQSFPAPDGSLGFGIHWGENRPKTNANVVYTLTTETVVGSGGPCGPPVQPTEAKLMLPAAGADIVDNGTGAPDCSKTPDLPGCLAPTTEAPAANSPGFDPMLFSMVALGVVYTLRRRRL